MRKGLLWVLGVWLFSAGQLPAQSSPAKDSAASDSPAPAASPSTNASDGERKDAAGLSTPTDCGPPCHGWVRAEYLFWWMKPAPLPIPLVTTGDPRVGFDPNNANTVNTAGAIGQPGTHILIGDHGARFPMFSGLRLTLGSWIDDEETVGIEGSGFMFERLTRNVALASDNSGNPPLYFPIFSEIAGAERGIPIADPLRGFSGDVGVHSTLRLWGAEANGVLTVLRNPGLELTLLGGFRYADLREHLQIDNTTTDLVFGNVTALSDFFETHNQFYGSQLGSRLAVQLNCFSLDITVKVAVGETHEVVETLGTITQLGPNPLVPPGLGTFPGGLFAQPSNIGYRKANHFSVLPSSELRCGFDVSQRARIFAGYNIMYWNEVVRPGNQVSRLVNLTQNVVLDPNGVGTLVGPAQPAPLFDRSAFWAQGLTFGLEVRF